jgi:hypothetical protein
MTTIITTTSMMMRNLRPRVLKRIVIDPLLSAYADDYILPPCQSVTNAAIVVIFAYLVALLTMEINYFRLAIYRSWRNAAAMSSALQKKKEEGVAGGDKDDGDIIIQQRLDTIQSAANHNKDASTANNGDYDTNNNNNNIIGMSLSSSFSTGENDADADGDDRGDELAEDECCCLDHHDDSSNNDNDNNHETNLNNKNNNSNNSNNINNHNNRDDEMMMIIIDDTNANADTNANDGDDATTTNKLLLRRTQHYQCIRHASAEAILSSLFIYTLTAWGVGYSTVGLDSKVIAIIAGGSQFVTAVMIVIMSAKIPQWVCVDIYRVQENVLYYIYMRMSFSHSHTHISQITFILTPSKISLLKHYTLVHYYLNTHTSLTTRPPPKKGGCVPSRFNTISQMFLQLFTTLY